MESSTTATANVMNEASKQTRPTPSPSAGGGGGGDDLISRLDDDVLLYILELVEDAKDVVRTGALSRRWRDLWTRAPVLIFDDEFESAGDVHAYVAAVSNVLARRARSEERVDFLATLLLVDHRLRAGQRDQLQLVSLGVEAAEAWIQYAVRHPVTSFFLDLSLPQKFLMPGLEVDEEVDVRDEVVEFANDDDDDDEKDEEEDTAMIDLDDLPSSANLVTMHLDINIVARVRLPSTAVFTLLTDLEVNLVKLENGSGDLLSRLLSSACCPRLKKLCMVCVDFKRCGGTTKQLVLDNEALLDVWLQSMEGMKSLELKTPNLLHLQVKTCADTESVTISAPRLEKLAFLHNSTRVGVHGGDLPCVWGLKVDLTFHVFTTSILGPVLFSEGDMNDASIGLMQRCSSATDLLVHLYVPEKSIDVIKDKIPELPRVTLLAVHVHLMAERHSFGDGVAGLLTRFNNLRYLSLTQDEVHGCKMWDEASSEEDVRDSMSFACDHQDHWESSSMSFVHLQKAEFRGLTGTDCELRFLQSILASATDIRKVNISFSVNLSLDGRMDEFQQKLLPHGAWAAACPHDIYGKSSYEWRPGPEEESLDVRVSDWILDWSHYC